MTTTETLRAALTALADGAPPPSVLDQTAWAGDATPSASAGSRFRRQSVLAVVASAAVVLAVVAIILGLAIGKSGNNPTSAGATPAYGTQLFGPNSMPGMELDSTEIARQRQIYTYDTPGAPYTQLAFELDVVVPDAALTAIMSSATPVTVGTSPGWFSTTPITAPNTVYSWLYEPAPTAKYDGRTIPDVSVVAWPVDSTRWAILFPAEVNGDHHALSQADLTARAASLVRDDTNQLAGVRVGYVPAGLEFAAAFNQPVSRSATVGAHTRPGPAGLEGPADRQLTFATGPGVNDPDVGNSILSVEVIDGVTITDRSGPSRQLPEVYGTDWHKATISGHLAWVSPQDILIQWGPVVIGVATSSRSGHDPLLSPAQLLHVAQSLQAPLTYAQQPYTLGDALPATVLG